MAANKEIRFSAKDTGVSTLMQRLRSDSKRLHEDMLRDAQASTNSQKEAIKYYEQQISLIERRNKLDREQSKFSLKNRYRQAASQKGADQDQLKDKYQKGLQQIKQGSEEDRMQVEILRELLDTTKEQHREELRHETKEGVKDRMHEERTQGGRNRWLDRGMMSTVGLATAMGQNEAGMSGAVNMVSGGMMASDNSITSITGAIIKVATEAVQMVSKEKARVFEPSALMGQSVEGLIQKGFGFGGTNRIEEMGLGREEYLQRYANSLRSYGGTRSEEQVVRDIQAEKAYGLDSEATTQMQRLTRTMDQFSESQDVMYQIHRSMVGTGALGSSDVEYARMNEIVKTAVEMQQSRFMRTGLTDGFESRLQLMRGLEGFGGQFADDQYKRATLQQLESGVATTPNKMVHAMKLRKAREIAPGKNPFELFAQIQSGDPRLIAPLIEDLAGSTQDDTLLMQRMYDMFGGQLSPQNVVALTKGVRQGKNIADMLPQTDYNKAAYAQSLEQKAEQGESETFAKAMKVWNDTIHEATKGMIELGEAIQSVKEEL